MTDNRVRIRAELENEVSKGLKTMRGDFDELDRSTGAQSILHGIGLGIGAQAWDLVGNAISGVGEGIGDAIQKASDMNETVSKAGVVFGDASPKVIAFGNDSAKSMGIAKQAAIDAASGFGQFFQGAGQSADAAEGMSEKMVRLAADLASFNNLDPTDTLQKLKSGLAGESEPLRSVGVFLTEAGVKAEGAKLGLADVHGELTEGAKILARYQLILDQTKDAQGDFERTSDGVANKERILNATIADREARLGQAGLPLEKAWLDVRLALADASGTFLDRLDAENAAMDRYREQGVKPTKQQISDLADMLLLANTYAGDLGSTLNDIGDRADKNIESVHAFTKANQELADALHDAWQEGRHLIGEFGGIVFTGVVQQPNQPHRGAAGNKRRRAGGGTVWPGDDVDVGETGMERLHLFPGGGGYVSPAAAGDAGRSGASPAVIVVQLDAAEIARVVDERLYYRDLRAGAAPASAR